METQEPRSKGKETTKKTWHLRCRRVIETAQKMQVLRGGRQGDPVKKTLEQSGPHQSETLERKSREQSGKQDEDVKWPTDPATFLDERG
ncbi:hypothetical protein NDU88_002484 [Pleurodeles waltl]|uniref:Uncharacterized protein n=1 Tax=Pleurodeles waltl TaxID=8319 RepID=A0AAV7RBI8_PLEWA|nr:hypothetical protein NDU88_002484 [Pleurodeles waltl]